MGLVVGVGERQQRQRLQVPGVRGDGAIVAGYLEDAGPRDRVFQLPCSIPEMEWYLRQGGLWLPGTGVLELCSPGSPKEGQREQTAAHSALSIGGDHLSTNPHTQGLLSRA